MKALCWNGVNDLRVERVPEPSILDPRDAILRVRASTTCGSDLHLVDGYVPTMKQGDVIGHEFLGEVVEVGRDVSKIARGDRVVVSSILGCGECWFCKKERYSLCDNSNPRADLLEPLLGHAGAGIFGYSHLFGGFAGAHAEYVRVPFADVGAFKVPEGLTDEQALFASDAFPTGYMGAEFCQIEPGQVICVFGAGGVGLMAMTSARLMGAERVIAVDRFPERLALAAEKCGAETLDYTRVDVLSALSEMTGGRGPDACIDAVGMEAHGEGLLFASDRVKQALHVSSDRGTALRDAIYACRKGGVVSVVGVYGLMDNFPIGVALNKGLTLRMAQMHGQRYIPRILEHIARGEADPSFLATHPMSLDDAAAGYAMFKHKTDGCVRAVFKPS